MKKIIITLIIFGVIACGSSYKTTQKTTQALDAMIYNKRFKIISTSAQPQVTNAIQQLGNSGWLGPGNTAGNINLIGNPNFLIMNKDSVKAYLPYYGERQFGGGYGNNGAIEFAGKAKDLQISEGKKSSYNVSFNIEDKNSGSEHYQVNITLFSNLKSTINMNSSQRFNIQYSGTIDSLTTEK